MNENWLFCMLGLTESRWAHFKILRCKVSMQKHSFEKSWIQRCIKETNKKICPALSLRKPPPNQMFSTVFQISPFWRGDRCDAAGARALHPSTHTNSSGVKTRGGFACCLNEGAYTGQRKLILNVALLNDLSLCPSQYRTLNGGRTEVLVLPPAITWRHSVPQRPLSYTFCGATEKCMGCLLVGEHCEHEPLRLFFFFSFF